MSPRPQEPPPARKKASSAEEPLNRKITFLVSPQMEQDVGAMARKLHVSTSVVLRALIRDGVEKYLGEREEGATAGSELEAKKKVYLELSDRLEGALKSAADIWGMPVQSLLNLIVSESLSGYITKGLELRDNLEASLTSKRPSKER